MCLAQKKSKYCYLHLGEAVEGVWRPGLYFQEEIYRALCITKHQQYSLLAPTLHKKVLE